MRHGSQPRLDIALLCDSSAYSTDRAAFRMGSRYHIPGVELPTKELENGLTAKVSSRIPGPGRCRPFRRTRANKRASYPGHHKRSRSGPWSGFQGCKWRKHHRGITAPEVERRGKPGPDSSGSTGFVMPREQETILPQYRSRLSPPDEHTRHVDQAV